MRSEDQLRSGDTGMIEDFRSMAMGKEVVGAEILVDLDEVEFAARFFAGAAGTRFAVANQRLSRGDEARLRKRPKSKDDACGVTARICNQLGIGDFCCKELRESVDSFGESRSVWRGQAIPVRKGFGGGEAKSAAKIDDANASIEKCWREIGRNFVRRGKESSASVAGDHSVEGKGAEEEPRPNRGVEETSARGNVHRWFRERKT